MNPYILSALDNESVLTGFDAAVLGRSRITAVVLAYIAEIDARHLYLHQGCESMKAFCMARLALSEDSAKKHIQVARIGRQLPVLFEAIATGRLTPYSVRLLAPRVNRENVEALIAECAGQTGEQVEIVLAKHFPIAEALRLDDGVALQTPIQESTELVVPQQSNAVVGAARHPQPRVAPLSETRFSLTVTLSRETHGNLRRAQELLAHAIPSRDIAQVLDRALVVFVAHLERKKFGAGASPRKPRTGGSVRAIRAHVRKAVYDRDGGRCAYVYEDGSRCGSRSKLEFDHVTPLAMGGKSTVENLRLLCRAHNQHAAEQAFGQGFIEEKKRRRHAKV
jgi:hypothetical protein